VPDPPRLARFLSERGRRLGEAIRLAESTDRQDIFTADALAWAHFQTGRLAEAQAKIKVALSTGSRDRLIREHAAAMPALPAGPLDEMVAGSPSPSVDRRDDRRASSVDDNGLGGRRAGRRFVATITADADPLIAKLEALADPLGSLGTDGVSAPRDWTR
jgi:hypothetical protein